MKQFAGKTLRWELRDAIVELTLDHEPANEIGTETLGDLEKFGAAIPALAPETAACIISMSTTRTDRTKNEREPAVDSADPAAFFRDF